jgi:hypothetical protein
MLQCPPLDIWREYMYVYVLSLYYSIWMWWVSYLKHAWCNLLTMARYICNSIQPGWRCVPMCYDPSLDPWDYQRQDENVILCAEHTDELLSGCGSWWKRCPSQRWASKNQMSRQEADTKQELNVKWMCKLSRLCIILWPSVRPVGLPSDGWIE